MASPRVLTEKMIKSLDYGDFFHYPNIGDFDRFYEKDEKFFYLFQKQFKVWITKTLTDPCWPRADRERDLSHMIKTIEKFLEYTGVRMKKNILNYIMRKMHASLCASF